jgi:hypothetical protein
VYTVDLLLRDLAEGGILIEQSEETGQLVITRRGDEQIVPPARFVIDDAALQARLDAAESTGKYLWPDREPRQGSYQLLLIHIDEELGGANGRVEEVRVTAEGVESIRRPNLNREGAGTEPNPDEEYRWTARLSRSLSLGPVHRN